MRYVVYMMGGPTLLVSERDAKKIRSAMRGLDGVVTIINLDNDQEKETYLNPRLVAFVYPQ